MDKLLTTEYNIEEISKIGVDDYHLVNIAWNIFLLIVPFFVCSFLINYWKKNEKNRTVFSSFFSVLIFLLWFAFIPNTAYVMTDVRHLLDYCPADSPFGVCAQNAWMIMFFFLYGWVGWVGFVFLLKQMKDFIDSVNKKGFYFILFIMPFISLGVLLGLLDRFNSWDLLSQPGLVFNGLLKYFTDFIYYRNWFVFTFVFYILYFVGEYIQLRIKNE